MLSSSNYVVTNDQISLFFQGWLAFHCVNIPLFKINSFVDKQRGWLHSFAIMNSAAVKLKIQISNVLGKYSKGETAGLNITTIFSSSRILTQLISNGCASACLPTHTPHTVHGGSPYFKSLSHLVFIFLRIAIVTDGSSRLIVVLISTISRMISNIESFFVYLLAIGGSPLEMSHLIPYLFIIGGFVFLLLMFKFLKLFWILTHHWMYGLQILFPTLYVISSPWKLFLLQW